MSKAFIESTHFNFLKFADDDEVQQHLRFFRLAMETLNNPMSTVPVQVVARGMITAAARISYIASKRMGYDHMDDEACHDLADLFYQALLDATENGELTQIKPS